MDQPALAADPRFRTRESRKQNEDELDAIITRWTSRHDRWEATEILQRAGVAAMPTLSNKDLAHDPHLKQRGFLVELEHPAVGRRVHAGVPWTMSETPCQVRRSAPLLAYAIRLRLPNAKACGWVVWSRSATRYATGSSR